MNLVSKQSLKSYVIMILILAAAGWLYVIVSRDWLTGMAGEQPMPAPLPVMALANAAIFLVIYGGVGFLGLLLARKTGFPELWTPGMTNRKRFLFPALTGVGIGVFFILADLGLGLISDTGRLPHPAFPGSILASVTAGIGEEILFRLFFIPFWMWIVSTIILRGRFEKQVFPIFTLLSALVFAAGHLPATMYLYGWTTVGEIPAVLMAGIFILNGVLSVCAAYWFRKAGFLAAVGVHLWTDIVWHVLWGGIAG